MFRRRLGFTLVLSSLALTLGTGPPSAPMPVQESGRIAFVSNRDGDPEIYVMQADGSDVERLTESPGFDGAPAWSPDGTRIAFASSRDGNGNIYIMNDDGSNQTRLTTHEADDGGPSWSPDGSMIAFESDRSGSSQVWRTNVEPGSWGYNLTQLTDDHALGRVNNFLAWSPDGRWIAFEADRDRDDPEIYLANAVDGSNQQRLTFTRALDEVPTWTPDGAGIVYSTDRDGEPQNGNYEIYIMNADGSDRTRLTNVAGADSNPSVSPDGARIAFDSSRSGATEIYVMNIDGTDQVQLTTPGYTAADDERRVFSRNPAWAQEGPDPNRPGAREVIQYDVPAEIDIDYGALDNIDTSSSEFGVVALPANVGKTLTGLFSKYTKHVAPNGKPIHILGQSGVSDLQMARAREILRYHLTDVPGTRYGGDKAAVANRMGDVRATLIYTNTQARAFAMYDILEPSDLALQDLYATESPVEGDYVYLHNEAAEGGFFTRDASYEEIMHLVHAKGIEETLPEYHAAIEAAEQRAVDAGIYRYGAPAPHEYIISGFDIYFGLWDHDPQGDGTSYGDEYPYHTRAEMESGDRPLFDLVEGFWPEYLTYNGYIDPSFEGTFVMVRNEELDYTYKSRFLVEVTLTGNKDTSVLGNDQDNVLTGNEGNNGFTGGSGDDLITGAGGTDRAHFSGVASEYRVATDGSKATVTDTVLGRDGTDELTGIEILVFADNEIDLTRR